MSAYMAHSIEEVVTYLVEGGRGASAAKIGHSPGRGFDGRQLGLFLAKHAEHHAHRACGQYGIAQIRAVSSNVSKCPARLLAQTGVRRGHHLDEVASRSLLYQILRMVVVTGGNVGQSPERFVLRTRTSRNGRSSHDGSAAGSVPRKKATTRSEKKIGQQIFQSEPLKKKKQVGNCCALQRNSIPRLLGSSIAVKSGVGNVLGCLHCGGRGIG